MGSEMCIRDRLWSVGIFEILGFHPHMDGGFNDRDVPVADRFDLVRPVLGEILSLA